MTTTKSRDSGIAKVRYTPPENYRLDLEIFSIGERAKGVNIDNYRGTHRVDFHLLIYVTSGRFTHTVDFAPIQCGPGSVLALRPSQMQCFDTKHKWDAWFVIFRPEFLSPIQASSQVGDVRVVTTLEELPVHFAVETADREAVQQSILQMYRDTKVNASLSQTHELLRHQLYALLLRLHLFQAKRAQDAIASPADVQRFKLFQKMVERNFSTQHKVSGYAMAMGISEKSLTRTTQAIAGVTAKSYIASRVALEGKRLLVHSALPVAAIADQLGFDESTNFVKFFKREAGCAPGEFRSRHQE